MMNKRRTRLGVSPLIAAVLMIAFGISIAAIMMSWGTNLFQEETSSVGNDSDELIQCSTSTLDLLGVGWSGSNLSITVSNSGRGSISALKIGVEDEDNSIWAFTEDSNLDSSDSQTIMLNHTQIDPTARTVRVASENCPTVRASEDVSSPRPVQVWEYSDDSLNADAIAVDDAGNTYVGGYGQQLVKVNSEGEKAWNLSIDGPVFVIDTFGDYVYVGSRDEPRVQKISTDGSFVWNFSGHNDRVFGLAVDSQGDVYSGSEDPNLTKHSSSDGSVEWTFQEFSGDVEMISTDDSDNVFVGTAGTDNLTKFDSTGSILWTKTAANAIAGIASDSLGNVIYGLGGWREHPISNLTKASSDSTQLWQFFDHQPPAWHKTNQSQNLASLAVDNEDYIYATGYRNGVLSKISPSGDLVWYIYPHIDNSQLNNLAVDEDWNVYVASGDLVRKFEQK